MRNRWERRAACRDKQHDPNVNFFPFGNLYSRMTGQKIIERPGVREAVMLCRRCPVRRECENVDVRGGKEGIWGGAFFYGSRRVDLLEQLATTPG